MKTAAAFKQSDITRALRGARAAGLDVTSLDISPTGEIRLRLKDKENQTETRENNWDEVLE